MSNTTGYDNTATGRGALQSNIDGYRNTGTGKDALRNNTTGDRNTGTGKDALRNNTTGDKNTAIGDRALQSNTVGFGNTAIGARALYSNTIGYHNIAIGYGAGSSLTTGDFNITIGSCCRPNETKTIRIGDSIQTRSFIAGIRGVTTGVADAIPVVIDSDGQLGTISSSRRYKEDISDMGEATDGLLELRPVLFRYKQAFADGEKPIQSGLIAEEVAEVFPGLVVYDEEGRPETVKYHLLGTMLLNEMQRHQQEKDAEIAAMQSELSALKEQVAALVAAR